MLRNVSIFTSKEIGLFFFELKSKFRSGIRSPSGFLYTAFTLIGVAWASWGIPSLNYSETSPETYGIYVIGFLISVMLDAIITWKKAGNDNPYEQAIAVIFIVVSLLLLIAASKLSLRTVDVNAGQPKIGAWKCGAIPLLVIILGVSIVMSLVLTGIDSKQPPIGPLDTPVADISDRTK